MQPCPGGGFTVASLYMALTGLPSYFAGNGNAYFEGTTKSNLTSIADILSLCGYETYHLSNNASFAGTRNLLTALGVQHILDGPLGEKYPECPMSGAYDMDIFNEAKKIAVAKRDKPFMMYISTTQTHGPDGYVDQRILDTLKNAGSTTLETAAISTDWLIGDFLLFLEQYDLMDNTAVYIYPDHNFWGYKSLLDRTGNRKSLWLLTNTSDVFIDSVE